MYKLYVSNLCYKSLYYWLPVEQRINFKILLLVYKCVQVNGPQYLRDLLIPYQPQRALRSQDKKYPSIPTGGNKTLKTYEECSFCIAGPNLWNTLPLAL